MIPASSKSHNTPDSLGPPPGAGILNAPSSHQGSSSQASQPQQPAQPQHSQNAQPYPHSSTISASHFQEQQTLRSLAGGNNGTIVTQTPVQQVLSSAADRWGLLGLLTMIRSVDPDTAMLGMGTDLSSAGFDLGVQEYVTRLTSHPPIRFEPALDIVTFTRLSLRHGPTLRQPTQSSPNSMSRLFTMSIRLRQGPIRPPLSVMKHYSSCSTRHREMFSKKLLRKSCKLYCLRFLRALLTLFHWRHNRNWRFHKEIRLWLTKESGTAPSQKAPTYERGVYTFFDPEIWERVKKELVIMYDLLEERAPLSVAGAISAPGHQGAVQQPLQALGMGLHGQGHQTGQQPQGSQPSHPSAQLHQQQPLADQIRMQGISARYQGTRTPGLGGL
jgi:CCR4-NOT transcription complex subunit 2